METNLNIDSIKLSMSNNNSNKTIDKPNTNKIEIIESNDQINNKLNYFRNSGMIKIENTSKKSGEDISKIIEKMNNQFENLDRKFVYRLHKDTNTYIIEIKNAKTNETIREIPSEKSLDLFAKMLDIAGLLVDEKS